MRPPIFPTPSRNVLVSSSANGLEAAVIAQGGNNVRDYWEGWGEVQEWEGRGVRVAGVMASSL